MPIFKIFKIFGIKLKNLNSLPLDKEKNLRFLVDVNLIKVLDLLLLSSEYITNFRKHMDTQAVATEIFRPRHPIYGQLFELQTRDVVRLIAGEA